MSPLDNLLSRLGSVRKSGINYSARCPAHQDKSASLSLSEGDDGRVLVNCFAGCTAKDVVDSVGLHLRDLFPDNGITTTRQKYSKRHVEKHLIRELSVLIIAINMRHEGEPIAPDDAHREDQAVERIRKMFGEVYE